MATRKLNVYFPQENIEFLNQFGANLSSAVNFVVEVARCAESERPEGFRDHELIKILSESGSFEPGTPPTPENVQTAIDRVVGDIELECLQGLSPWSRLHIALYCSAFQRHHPNQTIEEARSWLS